MEQNSSDHINQPLNKNYVHPQLGPYLAGLIEGDGHIYVPDTLYNDKGNRRYCFIRIVFTKPDKRNFFLQKNFFYKKILKKFITFCRVFTIKIRRLYC